MTAPPVPVTVDDPINAAVLAVSEDQLEGFQRDPLGEIARRSEVPLPTVIERIRAMLAAGTIRRVRQTLLSINLAHGALTAWQLPDDRLREAFDYMYQDDPFSGHVVIRTTDAASSGAAYRLWTTLKVPQGYSLQKHADLLARRTGVQRYRLMPAQRLFKLGVGHIRRRGLPPGSRADEPAEVMDTDIVRLSDLEWQVLDALKREFQPEEIQPDLWRARAAEAGVPLDEFFAVAESLQTRNVVGRFSTFLEHVKAVAGAKPVTRYNALFHWAVPPGWEIAAGQEVGRHHIMTHAYWRDAGADFHNVNVMGVAHGEEKAVVLAHKSAIDRHLQAAHIPVTYTTVFWGGRSEIKPSEISPTVYRQWCTAQGVDPAAMRTAAPA